MHKQSEGSVFVSLNVKATAFSFLNKKQNKKKTLH